MKKGNITQTVTPDHEQQKEEARNHPPISEELRDAIESLITQLRDIGPLETK